jgi:hypothetical protein
VSEFAGRLMNRIERLEDENKRLRGLLREARDDIYEWQQSYRQDRGSQDLIDRIDAALAYNTAPDAPHVIGTTTQPNGATQFDLIAHLRRQSEWSERTFGPGTRLHGVCDHIRKELAEIEADPKDISEWIDVTLLALDGAWRAGYTPEQIAAALEAKQTKNEGRKWPDWRTAEPGKAIEHDRTTDPTPAAQPSALDEYAGHAGHCALRPVFSAGPCNCGAADPTPAAQPIVSLADMQTEMTHDEKAALYGNVRDLYVKSAPDPTNGAL